MLVISSREFRQKGELVMIQRVKIIRQYIHR